MNTLFIIACLVATPPQEPLQVGVSDSPPMIIVDQGYASTGTYEALSGSDFDMFEEIARSLGWKNGEEYEYKIFPSFHQLMTALEEGTVPLGLSGISITHERLLSMHFSQPYQDSGQRILISPTKPKWSFGVYFGRFVRPEIAVPLATLVVCWMIFGVLFWLFEKKLPVIFFPENDNKPNVQTVEDGTKAAFDIGTTIGFGRYFPVTLVGQFIAIACFFCSSLLIGDVFSTLTVNKVEKLDNVINSPDDLKGKIIAGEKGTTSIRVAEAYDPARIIETGSFYEAVVEMRLGNAVAVVADEPVVLNYVRKNPDHAMVTGMRFHPEDYGIAFAMSSDPLRTGDLVNKFSLAITKLRDNGKLTSIEDHWFGE